MAEPGADKTFGKSFAKTYLKGFFMKNKIIAVCGPTAVGKTKYSIEIAKELNGEIVSCDSMQLYKYMDIGSAKPTLQERAQAVHHLVDVIDPREEFSCAVYKQMAQSAISDIVARGKIPVIAGGTGLYLNSLLYDMDFDEVPPANEELRAQLYKEAEEHGALYVYNKLKALDENAANRIHPNNVKKVIRALEAASEGRNIKDFATDLKKNEDISPILIGLNRDRAELYDRINMRVDILMQEGLVDEVKSLMDCGLTEENISMKGIGYKEVIAYLQGEYDYDFAVDLIKKNTRHYAKRQLTWFRRYDDMKWFNISEYDNDESCLEDILIWLRKQL